MKKRISTPNFGVVVLLFLTFGYFIASPYAETTSTKKTPPTVPDDFLSLADMRGSLSSEIPTLEREIKDLQDKATELEFMKTDLEETKRTFDIAQKKKNPSESEKRFLADAEYRIAKMETEIKTTEGSTEANKELLNQKQILLNSKKDLAKEVQTKIKDMLSPEQGFKRTMSIMAGVLIGSVIIGFFLLAAIDPTIRQTIFAGQAGMQFLTLFSLVIAIILFGITNILEGRELAALLGGISGYILGHVTASLRPPTAGGGTSGQQP